MAWAGQPSSPGRPLATGTLMLVRAGLRETCCVDRGRAPKGTWVLTVLGRFAGGGVSLLTGKWESGVTALLGEELEARGSSFTVVRGGDTPGPTPVAGVTTTAAGVAAVAAAAPVAVAAGTTGVTAEVPRGRGDDAKTWDCAGGGDAVPLRSWRRLSFLWAALTCGCERGTVRPFISTLLLLLLLLLFMLLLLLLLLLLPPVLLLLLLPPPLPGSNLM